MEYFIGGIMAACALLFLILKFGPIKKVLGFSLWIDIGTTLILGIMFFGTLGGMMIAITAGTIVSVVLFIAEKIFGHDKLTMKGWVNGRDGSYFKSTVNNAFRSAGH